MTAAFSPYEDPRRAVALPHPADLAALDEEPPDLDEPAPLLGVADRGRADWHLREIARLEAEFDRQRAGVEETVAQLDAWLATQEMALVRAVAWHAQPLEHLARALADLDPKHKTTKLPAGQLCLRAQQPVWDWDTDVFGPWAFAHAPGVLSFPPPKPQPPAIDVNAAKALLTRTPTKAQAQAGQAPVYGVTSDGERPPGVTVQERPAKFTYILSSAEPEPTNDPQDD